jgi:hypothetical protein
MVAVVLRDKLFRIADIHGHDLKRHHNSLQRDSRT